MLKKFTLVFSLIFLVAFIYDFNYNIAHTNGTGAPIGRTGNPGEFGGLTCSQAGCHVGGPSVTNETVEFSSDIPGTGYTPGETYTITITMTKQGGSKFGFEVSPQDNSGSLLGTLLNPGTGAQLIGGSKYVTHTISGTAGSGSKSWTFDWTAPTTGTGDVTFWGAFNFTNNNNSVSGDVIVNDTYTVSESTVSVSEIALGKEGFALYPSPVDGPMNVEFNLSNSSELSIELYSIDGKRAAILLNETLVAGNHNLTFDMNQFSAGIYLVKLSNEGKDHYKKVIVK